MIAKAPMRISLFGGGSDLPMYRELTGSGGCVLSCTINQYVTVKPVATYSPVAPGSGLGGSGAFHVASTLAAHPYLTRADLFDAAWQAETAMNRHAGWQDVAASTYGGLNLFTLEEELQRDSIAIPAGLDARLLLFATGITRTASTPLALQAQEMRCHLSSMAHAIQLAHQAATWLEAGKIDIGDLLHEAWTHKRELAGVETDAIALTYRTARTAGATGGKLCGAGGGGYLLFYVEPDAQASVRAAMDDLRLSELVFNLTTDGATVG